MMAYREGKSDLNFDWINDAQVRAKQISVSANGSHVWYVNPAGKVHYRNGYEGAQQDISPGFLLEQISVSGDGNHVWGIDSSKQLHYRAGVGGSWMLAEGPELYYLSVNADGYTLYGINIDT